MAEFITRVELHGATEPDYEFLHSEMAKKGFSRTIVDQAGATHQLPSAEYYISGELSVAVVHQRAKQAADATGKGSWILVSQIVTARFDLPLIRTLLRH